MIRINFNISDELHHYLKIHTARTKSNIKDFVTEAIYKRIEQEKVPNEKTVKAFEDSDNSIGITKFASVEEMFKSVYQELEEEGFKVEKHVRAPRN